MPKARQVQQVLRESLADELQAVEDYHTRASVARSLGDEESAALLEEVAGDEEHHAGQFESRLEGLAEAAAQEALGIAADEVGFDSLLLNSVPYLGGSPGLVVDEARARATPCKCVEYKPGKRLCWSPGVIGALSDEQEATFCPTTIQVERPGTVERMRRWQESVEKCKAELAQMPEAPGAERVSTWITCMSRELRAAGVEA